MEHALRTTAAVAFGFLAIVPSCSLSSLDRTKGEPDPNQPPAPSAPNMPPTVDAGVDDVQVIVEAATTKPLTASGPITAVSGKTYSLLHITNPNGPCITVGSAEDVHIVDSEIGPCAGAGITTSGAANLTVLRTAIHDTSGTEGHAIDLSNTSNVTVENSSMKFTGGHGINGYEVQGLTVKSCTFEDNSSAIYLSTSSSIVVEHNRSKNVRGPVPRGQFIQLNTCSGPGIRVACNHLTNEAGKSNPEDAINMYHTSGTATSPVLIEDNYINGGGPSQSGGGILNADDGASHLICRRNVLVNPGQYGIGVATGTDIEISDNKLYASQQPWTNVGLVVWNPYGGECSSINVMGNQVFWINRDGVPNSMWIPSSGGEACAAVTQSGNALQSAIVSATMPSPACAANAGAP